MDNKTKLSLFYSLFNTSKYRSCNTSYDDIISLNIQHKNGDSFESSVKNQCIESYTNPSLVKEIYDICSFLDILRENLELDSYSSIYLCYDEFILIHFESETKIQKSIYLQIKDYEEWLDQSLWIDRIVPKIIYCSIIVFSAYSTWFM